jgi:hypothetical protein
MKSEPAPANNIIIEAFKCCAELVSLARNIGELRGNFIDVRHEFNHTCIALLDIQCQSKNVGDHWGKNLRPVVLRLRLL